MKPNLLTILSIAGAMLIFSGCGKSDTSAQSGAANDAKAANSVREFEITASDTMKFNITEIRALPGEKLRITLANIGQMPKQAMAHNWALLVPMSDADVMALSSAAASRAPEYLPEDRTKVLAHTKLLGPKETDSIEIVAPSAPGEYPYICTFPGHAALMRGKLIVSAGPSKS
jgi:azurin